jgi:hypothetical protein
MNEFSRIVPPVVDPQQAMPASIATAVWSISTEVEDMEKTGDGAGFKTTKIADVLKHVKPLMKAHGVTVKPVEVSSELQDLKTYNSSGAEQKATFYVGKYKFRFMHKDGSSWVDQDDVRTQHVMMSMDGTPPAVCQSMALKTFLIGLFEIPTPDPEADQSPSGFVKTGKAKAAKVPTSPQAPYGVTDAEGTRHMSADGVFDYVSLHVAPFGYQAVSDFHGNNGTALSSMFANDKPVWLKIKRVLDDAAKDGAPVF